MPIPWDGVSREMGPVSMGGLGGFQVPPGLKTQNSQKMPPPGLGGALADLESQVEAMVGEIAGLADMLAPVMYGSRPVETMPPELEAVPEGGGCNLAARVVVVTNRVRAARMALRTIGGALDL